MRMLCIFALIEAIVCLAYILAKTIQHNWISEKVVPGTRNSTNSVNCVVVSRSFSSSIAIASWKNRQQQKSAQVFQVSTKAFSSA